MRPEAGDAARLFWDSQPEALCHRPHHHLGCTPLHKLQQDKQMNKVESCSHIDSRRSTY